VPQVALAKAEASSNFQPNTQIVAQKNQKIEFFFIPFRTGTQCNPASKNKWYAGKNHGTFCAVRGWGAHLALQFIAGSFHTCLPTVRLAGCKIHMSLRSRQRKGPAGVPIYRRF